MDEIFSSRPDDKLKNADSEIKNYILSLEKKLKNDISLTNLNKDIDKKCLRLEDELNALKLERKRSSICEGLHRVEIEKLHNENAGLAAANHQLRQQIINLQRESQQLPKICHKNTASATVIKTKETSQPQSNNVYDNDPDANSVLVKGMTAQQLNLVPKINIIELARLMNVKTLDRDIVKVSKMERKYYERHNLKPDNIILIVQFRTPELKVEFLKNKEKLKVDDNWEDIEIMDYVSDEVYNLYQYTKILKSHGYSQIYWRNNSVYAKKTRSTLCTPVLIKSKEDVDILKRIKDK